MPNLSLSPLTAISPVDGRYSDKTSPLREFFSEYALIRQRVRVEIEWIKFLAQLDKFTEIPRLSPECLKQLNSIVETFDEKQAELVKAIEQQTNHDVKAVEYYLREHFKKHSELAKIERFIHFSCTSEDINNLAWALSLFEARASILQPFYQKIETLTTQMAVRYAHTPMPARTHGQIASPTTVGKEFANYTARLHRQQVILENIAITAKFNGAVGNYNAHHISYPEIDWLAASQYFIQSFGLEALTYTTQIEPHDNLAELFDVIARINRILLDLCRDIWGYIALDYFIQIPVATETGSSTMPHKINPIDFENAEGNFGIANALARHFSEKLPLSRWQRDLSDSTTLRSMGLVFAHTLIALQSLDKGLGKIAVNEKIINAELEQHWEILSEAIQTVMRRYGVDDGYEQLKELTRGKDTSKKVIVEFIENLPIPDAAKQALLASSPQNYIGLADELALNIEKHLKNS